MIVHVLLFVCFLFTKRVSGSSYTVENASNAALVQSSPEMKPVLAAVGSATVAVLSCIDWPFFAVRRDHVVYNNCALYMLYKQQCCGFYYCSKRVISTTGGLGLCTLTPSLHAIVRGA